MKQKTITFRYDGVTLGNGPRDRGAESEFSAQVNHRVSFLRQLYSLEAASHFMPFCFTFSVYLKSATITDSELVQF